MNEKRFIVENYTIKDRNIDEKYIDSSYHIGDNGIAGRLCDILNSLDEENKRLMANANNDLYDELYEQLQKTEKKVKNLCEENEKLRSAVSILQEETNLLSDYIRSREGLSIEDFLQMKSDLYQKITRGRLGL